jgi:CRP-like cAMP-binding protein
MDILKMIGTVALFQGVSAERLKSLAERANYKNFKAGELVIGETDPIRAFYVVVSGQMKLYKSSAEGKEQTLYLLGAGEPFGMCTAFATDSFPASVRALSESAVLIIPGQAMEAIAAQEPTLLLNIIQVLSKRLKESMTLIESLALMEIPQRLASFLLHDLGKEGQHGKSHVQLTITHRELAKILGSTPEALSRALKKMARDGLIEIDGRTISVLNLDDLEALAGGE